MKTSTPGRTLKTLILAASLVCATTAHAVLDYQVTNGNDSGVGSLRKAMENANLHPGPDTITFAMGANKTIIPTAQLPAIFGPVTIDGTTQPGYAGSPLVEIDGENAGGGDGLFVQGGPTIIRGLIINRFGTRGIEIHADSTKIEGCYIGTDKTGTIALGNGAEGILIGSDFNTIGANTPTQRNVISGNGGSGISISASGSGNSVRGNFVGVDATGLAALGNGAYGIRVLSKANAIGEAGAGNLISGNVRGVSLEGTANTVRGNLIGLNGIGTVALPNDGDGIEVYETDNEIGGSAAGAGNVISGNAGSGIDLGANATGCTVVGNTIGTNPAGTAALGNGGYGVVVRGASNTIGGILPGTPNLISGNYRGLTVGGAGNLVAGNTIGLDRTGTAALPNGESGVSIGGPNNVIGGTVAAARNLISGNKGSGIDLAAAATGSSVLGNRIGTDVTGALALGNTGFAIVVRGAGTTIGGSDPGEGNLISGNGRGVAIGAAATDTVVQGNTIGLNATRTAKLPNQEDGIDIYGFGNLIGGADAGAGNIISGNKIFGISIYEAAAHDNVVQGNKIGTGPDGATLLGNGYFGIRIVGAFNNTIGGTDFGAGNVIAGNGWSAVRVTWGTGNAILRNSVFENVELGIDLDPRGVSANDALDADFGPNGGQNFPVVESVLLTGGNKTKIEGRIESKANEAYRIELFSTPACDDSGFGEGRNFLAAVDVVTDASGHADWASTYGQPIVDPYVTATATSADDGTSEFSPCAAVGGPSSGTFQFAASPFVGWEFEQSVKIAVTRTFGSSGAVSVHYETGGGNATPGVDYTAVSGTLSFADGEVVKTFQIPVVLDQIDEGNQESIGLTLSGATGGATLGAWATSELLLIDYDVANPAVTFQDATVVEGAGGAKMAFTVSVTPTDHVVEVGYATADGSAHAGEDFDAKTGTLVFQPGGPAQTVLVPIIGDAVQEGSESFYLNLISLEGAVFNDPTGEGVIVDDDVPLPANSSPVCTGGTTIANAQLVIKGLDGNAGDESMRFDGRLVFATGTPAGYDSIDSTTRGAQVLIEDLGSGIPLVALTHQGNPIPGGALASSPCDPTAMDGWVTTPSLTTYRYKNRSGALASASCAPGSAGQVRLFNLNDRRAVTGKVRVRLNRTHASIAQPTGPVRATIVLGADAAASASGACGVHTFASCTLDALGAKVTCK